MDKQLFFLLFLVSSLFALEPIAPVPVALKNIDLPKAKLGRMLFLDNDTFDVFGAFCVAVQCDNDAIDTHIVGGNLKRIRHLCTEGADHAL